jgi:hypothetical protein
MLNSHPIVRSIREHGKNITLRKTSEGTYSVSLGTISGQTNTSYTIKGYLYDNTMAMIGGDSLLKGERDSVVKGGSWLMIYGPDFDSLGTGDTSPNTSYSVVYEGDTKNIVNVVRVRSGSNAMVYLMQMKD